MKPRISRKLHPSKYSSCGKVPRSFLEDMIFKNLGSQRSEVVVGPGIGVDASVVKIGADKVLASTADPLSLVPALGPEDSAWMSVNLIASDLATTGLTPQYALFDLNLSPGMNLGFLSRYWKAISMECSRLGTAIIGGHTGKFEGIDSTVVGGGFMLATGESESCLYPRSARNGDLIILTKGAAISTTGILSRIFPNKISKILGKRKLHRAQKYFKLIPAVEDVVAAVSGGVKHSGVTAMHDVAEGGVLGALYELAAASSLGLLVQRESIHVSEESRSVCDVFGIDPHRTLGEGAMLIACHPGKSDTVLENLARKGTEAWIIGQLRKPEFGIKINENGRIRPIVYPTPDPYWDAYVFAMRSKWD